MEGRGGEHHDARTFATDGERLIAEHVLSAALDAEARVLGPSWGTLALAANPSRASATCGPCRVCNPSNATLRTLASGDMHGWGISQRLQQISQDVL